MRNITSATLTAPAPPLRVKLRNAQGWLPINHLRLVARELRRVVTCWWLFTNIHHRFVNNIWGSIVKYISAFKPAKWVGLLSLSVLCATAQAGAISASVGTGTNASLKITNVSSGSNSGATVPGVLFWNVQIGAGDTFDAASGTNAAINLWGNQASSGTLATALFFGVFSGFVTPTGATTNSYAGDTAATFTPLFSQAFTTNMCPAGGCNQFAWQPSLTAMGLTYAQGNNLGQFTIAVWTESSETNNGRVWKTSTRNGMTLTEDPIDVTPPLCTTCGPDPVLPDVDLPVPGSAALLALGLLGVGAVRRKTA